MKDTVDDEVKEWRARNPIRRWIEAKPAPRGARLAYLVKELGLKNRFAVYKYMNGVNLPESARFAKLLAIIRCSSESYMRWYNQGPSGETPCESADEDTASTRKPS